MPESPGNIKVLPAGLGRMMPVTLVKDGKNFIKVDFPANKEGVVERMWVRVETFDSRVGILYNEPMMVQGVENGDIVFFTKGAEDHEHYVMSKTFPGGQKDA